MFKGQQKIQWHDGLHITYTNQLIPIPSLNPFQDIVILRFDGEDEDTEAYLAMVNYLVGKHRCGVIKSGYHGIKDMYLLPLLKHSPVPPQLLPFDGPGQLHAVVV